ncbi:MAG: hypothetical protein HY842_04615 [Bacteroidetes bacterium]|nr:hypothetical protein [Bacteroidota bacterium]
MRAKYLPLVFLFTLIINGLNAQGTAFGIKGGLTLGVQKWNGFDQDPLFKYHGILSAESIDETAQFSVFAQVGYHLKGSALRNRNFFDVNGNAYRPSAQEFIFKNISLTFGGKRKYDLSDRMKGYYLLGLRGDYTLGTNLDKYKAANEQNGGLFFPDNAFVKDWNYGVTLGGGFEFALGELMGALLEFTVNPDFSYQYRQQAIPNVRDPYTGQNRTLPERTIRNITFEVTAGFRFLRKVEYID